MLPSLSIASWLIESKKWQRLIKHIKPIDIGESIFQNLTSQAASFLTPLRAGEFLLKASYFKKSLRKTIMKLVFMGNAIQMLVTSILGAIGFLLVFHQPRSLILFVLTILALLLIFCYPYFTRFFKNFNFLEILGWSILRYLLFSSCWLLLLTWTTSTSITTIAGAIMVMYLSVSILPGIQIFDLALKWSVASFFTELLQIPIEFMTAIVGIIYINNTLLPVFLGCLMLPFQPNKEAVPV